MKAKIYIFLLYHSIICVYVSVYIFEHFSDCFLVENS